MDLATNKLSAFSVLYVYVCVIFSLAGPSITHSFFCFLVFPTHPVVFVLVFRYVVVIFVVVSFCERQKTYKTNREM